MVVDTVFSKNTIFMFYKLENGGPDGTLTCGLGSKPVAAAPASRRNSQRITLNGRNNSTVEAPEPRTLLLMHWN